MRVAPDIERTGIASVIVSNVLSEDKRNQVIALGQPGWSLRRIQNKTGVRRETAAGYLKAAGIAMRPPGAWGKRPPEPKPANEVFTDSVGGQPAKPANVFTGPEGEQTTNPAKRVFTGSASSCEPWREQVEQAIAAGRNAMSIWQQLVDQHGYKGSYQRVRAYIRLKRTSPQPVTAPPPSPRTVAGWILRRPTALSEAEQIRL